MSDREVRERCVRGAVSLKVPAGLIARAEAQRQTSDSIGRVVERARVRLRGSRNWMNRWDGLEEQLETRRERWKG